MKVYSSPLVVNGVVSGASPPIPKATFVDSGALTGSLVICCHIVCGSVGCTVVSGPVTLPALTVRSQYQYIQVSKHQSQSISNSIKFTLATSHSESIHCWGSWNTFRVPPSKEGKAGPETGETAVCP